MEWKHINLVVGILSIQKLDKHHYHHYHVHVDFDLHGGQFLAEQRFWIREDQLLINTIE